MSWPVVALGEIFDIARGGSPRPIKDYITDDPDGINWIMIGDASENPKYITKTKKRIIERGMGKSRMVYPGDFLLTNSMSFGHPYILKTTGCIHDGWLVLRDKTNKVDHDYFYHLLGSNAVYSEFKRRAAGAVVKNLNIDLVKRVKIPLPPLAEQKRIAAILDKADAICHKRQTAIKLADDFLRATFLDMFGDPVTNPKGWEETELQEVATIASGVTKGRKFKNKSTIHVPYMRVANIQDGHIDLTEIKEIEALETDVEKYALRPGDLLLTEGGDPDKLGRGAIWKGEIEPCIHQNHIFKVRINNNNILPEYLSSLIGSSRGKRFFFRAAKQTTGIASINMTQLKSFPLLVPPVNLQKKYVRLLNEREKLLKKVNFNINKNENFFNSLTQRAFRGELQKT